MYYSIEQRSKNMEKFSKKACAYIGNLLPSHSHMATCVALGGGATV